MKKNGLIIIGGNSKLISKFLNNNLYSLYQKIIIISHRKYNGNDDYEIIEFLISPTSLYKCPQDK